MSATISDQRPENLLLFGASGQIGSFLLPRLQALRLRFSPVSRQASTEPGALSFDVYNDVKARGQFDALLSAGPLDGCVRWLNAQPGGLQRVVAFASTSAVSKQHSPDPAERALANKLIRAEAELVELCQARGAALTILRPTMIWGAGRDATLSRAAGLARRWRFLPCSGRARRQPVHADDLACVALTALLRRSTPQPYYDLPGGETLAMQEILRRIAHSVRALALPFPARLFRVLGAGVRARLDNECLFDSGPAQCDLNYAPRGFTPNAADWEIR